jgi:hypothetical protein
VALPPDSGIPPLPWDVNGFVPAPGGAEPPIPSPLVDAGPPAPIAPVDAGPPPDAIDPYLAAMQPPDLGDAQIEAPGNGLPPWLATPEADQVQLAAAAAPEQPQPDLSGGEPTEPAAQLEQPGPIVPMTDAELAQYAYEQGPEYVAQKQAEHDAALQSWAADRQLENVQADRAWAERNRIERERRTAIAQARSEQLWQRSVQLAQTEIDPDRWWSSRSTGQQIAMVAAGALGGFLNPTGANSTANLMSQAIDRDVDAQKANLANQRGLLDQQSGLVQQLYNEIGDANVAAEAARVAMYTHNSEQIKAEAQKYDINGSTYLKLVALSQQSDAKAAEAKWKMAGEIQKREIEAGEYDLKREAEARQQWEGKQAAARGWAAHKLDREKFLAEEEARKNPVVKPTDAKALLEIEQEQRGEIATDTSKNVLGKFRAKTDEARAGVRKAIRSYETFRPQLRKLMEYTEELGRNYQGAGSERWSGAERAKYNKLRRQLGERYARVMQPTGILTNEDIERGSEAIPEASAWTRNTNPQATYEVLTDLMDSEFDATMEVELEGFDRTNSPTARNKAADTATFAPKPAAATRADLLTEASTPLAAIGGKVPDDAIQERIQAFSKLSERTGDWKNLSEFKSLIDALDASRADLTPEQYKTLKKHLAEAIDQTK